MACQYENFEGNRMSKYSALWEYVQKRDIQTVTLTFDEIADIVGLPMDHSF